jgi:hypothetical protein
VTPRSSFEVPSLRWMRKVKCFSTYFIEILKEARQASASFRGRYRGLLREPRRMPERLEDHLFPKKPPISRG